MHNCAHSRLTPTFIQTHKTSTTLITLNAFTHIQNYTKENIIMRNKRLWIFLSIFCLPMYAMADTFKACNNPWPPYIHSINEGMSVEIVKQAMALSGHKVRLSLKLWHQCLKGVTDGKSDLLIASWRNDEREKYFLFSDPYFESDIVLIENPKNPINYNGLGSLTGKQVGVIEQYYYFDEFENVEFFTKVSSGSFVTSLRKLKTQKIDATLEDKLVADYEIKDGAIEPGIIRLHEKPLAKRAIYVVTAKKNAKGQEIINAFNTGLKKLKLNQAYDDIVKQYTSQ